MQDNHYYLMHEKEKNHWWYRVRRKMVCDIITKQKVLSKIINPKILDIGCGPGEFARELEKIGNYYGLDKSETAVNYCKEKISSVKVGDILNIPYEDNYFDVVLALDVLEHVEDDERALMELRRVVNKNGIVIIFVPAFDFLWSITDVLSNHYRRYTLGIFGEKIKKNGFKVLKRSYFNFFLFLPIAFIRLFIRLFGIKAKSELETGFLNNFLYYIFMIESKIINYVNFPFGVSILFIIKKT